MQLLSPAALAHLHIDLLLWNKASLLDTVKHFKSVLLIREKTM